MIARLLFVDVEGMKGRDVGWDIISFFQNSPIVHVGLVFGDVVYETSPTVYHKVTMEHRKAGCHLHLFDVPGDAAPALDYCESILGTPYDYTGIAGLGVMLLCERVLNWMLWPVRKWLKVVNDEEYRLVFVGNPLHLTQALYCAEAAVMALRKINPSPIPEWWFGASVTAPQMMRYAMDQGWRYEEVRG